MTRLVSTAWAVLTVAALSGSFPGWSDVQAQTFDLNQLERQGKLEAAYEQAVAEGGGGGLFGSSERQQQVEAMRERLAQREQARLEGELKKSRQVFGVAAVATSESLRAQGDKLKKYDEARHAQWLQRLDTEVERARKVMETVRAKLGQTPETDLQARLDLMKSLALLGGAGSEEEKAYLQATDAAKAAAYDRGVKARTEVRHGEAGTAFEFVVRLDRGYKDAEKLLLLSRLSLLEGLWRGAADEAVRTPVLELLKATVNGPEFSKYRAEASPEAAKVQAANLEQVSKMLAEGRLIDAIGGVLRGRRITTILGSTGRTGEEAALLARLREASARAAESGMPGLAYAYQRVAEELIPKEPETARLLAERRQAANAALRPAVRLTVDAASAAQAPLAEGLKARVLKAWPADLSAVEGAGLADWEFRITLSEAKVEADERKGRKVVRPPGSNEDIGVDLFLLRKKASLTLAVSLTEPDLPAAPTNETFSSQAEDQRHDGIQVGSFSLPVKLAELPADAAMLDKLADDAARAVIGKLGAAKADPARRFGERAARLAKAGQAPAAANALVMLAVAREQAGQPAKAEYDRGQRDALLAGPALLVKKP